MRPPGPQYKLPKESKPCCSSLPIFNFNNQPRLLSPSPIRTCFPSLLLCSLSPYMAATQLWALAPLALLLVLQLAGACHAVPQSLEAEQASVSHFQPPMMNWINGMVGLCIASAAVAVAAELSREQACLGLLLCLAFHAGIALVIRAAAAPDAGRSLARTQSRRNRNLLYSYY
uniref:Uncharacterized protein n=1 Tax=Oryza nivara TaxID=4536 RepID=A0A0E0I7F5_ORYNI